VDFTGALPNTIDQICRTPLGIVIVLPNGVRQIWSMVFGRAPVQSAQVEPVAAEAHHA
jgi:hypothetical protein